MSVPAECPLFVESEAEDDTFINVYQNGKLMSALALKAGETVRGKVGLLDCADEITVTIEVSAGTAKLHALCFGDIEESRYDSFLEIKIPQI